MNNVIEAEAGEHVAYLLSRTQQLAIIFDKVYIAKHNGISVIVNPESCYADICTIYDLKSALARATK